MKNGKWSNVLGLFFFFFLSLACMFEKEAVRLFYLLPFNGQVLPTFKKTILSQCSSIFYLNPQIWCMPETWVSANLKNLILNSKVLRYMT